MIDVFIGWKSQKFTRNSIIVVAIAIDIVMVDLSDVLLIFVMEKLATRWLIMYSIMLFCFYPPLQSITPSPTKIPSNLILGLEDYFSL